MIFRSKVNRQSRLVAALGAAALVGLLLGTANAQQTDPMDDLLDKLKAKGVLSDDEYQTLKKAREDEQIELRQERRRQAQQAAQQAEKEQKQADEAAKKPKFDASPGIKSIQLFGDVRLRYESRVADSSFHVGPPPPATGSLPGGPDSETLDRWRYALRIGIRGDLVEDWFYTLRFDTGTNPRSSWVTFGNNVSNAAGGQGPFGRGGDGIVVGQAYVGWRATPWFTVQAGKMANPLFTTPMVWDPDINPEGIAERINYPVNDKLSLFANFGQFVYQNFIPNSTSGGFGGISNDGYLFAWQGGVGYKFDAETNAKVGLTFYNYTGFPGTYLTGGGAFTSSTVGGPNGFGGPFANGTLGAANSYPTNQAGLQFANGVNNLRYWELPVEVNFPLGGISAQVFGDVGYNIQADDRAQKGSFANLGSQAFAYQAGV
ncbi:MAG TPA: putative porin, partial [Candidatus Acidoferrales bacterium]|nr:putative porin [Candidatus Acidoferrales bacterium]